MNASDMQRVSIDSMSDWERIENNYKTAVISELQSQIRARGLHGEQDALMAYVQRVCPLSSIFPTYVLTRF